MYAIIENGNKQYKVSEGDVVRVEKLKAEVGEEVSFNVLMVADENGVKVGSDVKTPRSPQRSKRRISTARSLSSSISPRRTSARSRATVSPSPQSRSKRSPFDCTGHPKRGERPNINEKEK